MIDNQKDYWNKVADEKNFTTPIKVQVFSEMINKEAKILDIGCGYGRVLNELSLNGYKNLYGVDFSYKMIERGRKQFPKINFTVQEDKRLPYEDNSFDSIILFAVLTCIVVDEDQIFLMNEIKRVLKPNGLLYINDFLLNTDERNVERYNMYEDKYNKYGVFELSEGAILRHHDLKWIKEITSDFKEVKLEKVEYTTMNGNKSNGVTYLGVK